MIDDFLLLSLILPCYNVEKYIAQCLDSIYNQNISETLYEVICVNDCSQDGTRNIILEYQKKHTNLILIDHLVNRKLGTARNTGRAVARGKYIWNIDSDDYIKPNVFKTLLEVCESNQLDILMFNFDHFVSKVESLNVNYPFPDSFVFDGVGFLNKYCLDKFGEISPVWSQMYNRDFLNKNDIYSPEINMGEDVPYTLKAILLAKRVMSITRSCYVYRSNENSLGGNIETTPSSEKLYEKCFKCSKHVMDLIKLIPKKEIRIIHEYNSVCKYIISLYPEYLKNMTMSELHNFRRICRKGFRHNLSLIRLMNKKNFIIYFFVVLIPLIKVKK